jgi:hypothetical protein
MSAKILSAVVTAILLGTTALASAQGRPDWNDPYLRGLTPDYAVQQNPYAGPAWSPTAICRTTRRNTTITATARIAVRRSGSS